MTRSRPQPLQDKSSATGFLFLVVSLYTKLEMFNFTHSQDRKGIYRNLQKKSPGVAEDLQIVELAYVNSSSLLSLPPVYSEVVWSMWCTITCIQTSSPHFHITPNWSPETESALVIVHLWLLVMDSAILKRYVSMMVVQCVRHLGLRSVGRGFKSCSRQCCVTTLGKLFTPVCLCHQAV